MKTTDKTMKAFNKFNEELKAFAEYTGDEMVTLYEDAYTTRVVKNFKLYNNGKMTWDEEEFDYRHPAKIVKEEYLHIDDDDVKDSIKFWKACLRRAKKYWSMDSDTLDAIQNGEKEE